MSDCGQPVDNSDVDWDSLPIYDKTAKGSQRAARVYIKPPVMVTMTGKVDAWTQREPVTKDNPC